MAELTNDGTSERYEVLVFAPEGDVLKKFATEDKAQRYAARPEVAQWNPLLNHVITMTVTELLPLRPIPPGTTESGDFDG